MGWVKGSDRNFEALSFLFQCSLCGKVDGFIGGMEGAVGDNSGGSTDPSAGQRAEVIAARDFNEAVQELADLVECACCMERPASIALACGHIFCCREDCQSRTISACPTCRRPVDHSKSIELFGMMTSLHDLVTRKLKLFKSAAAEVGNDEPGTAHAVEAGSQERRGGRLWGVRDATAVAEGAFAPPALKAPKKRATGVVGGVVARVFERGLCSCFVCPRRGPRS